MQARWIAALAVIFVFGVYATAWNYTHYASSCDPSTNCGSCHDDGRVCTAFDPSPDPGPAPDPSPGPDPGPSPGYATLSEQGLLFIPAMNLGGLWALELTVVDWWQGIFELTGASSLAWGSASPVAFFFGNALYVEPVLAFGANWGIVLELIPSHPNIQFALVDAYPYVPYYSYW